MTMKRMDFGNLQLFLIITLNYTHGPKHMTTTEIYLIHNLISSLVYGTVIKTMPSSALCPDR